MGDLNSTRVLSLVVLTLLSGSQSSSAQAECPIQFTPARLVVPYGGPGYAFCYTTSAGRPREMFWETRDGALNISNLWSAEVHQNWDPRPVCVAVFDGSGRCQKPFDFTMYQAPEQVLIRSVNHTGPMVEGVAYRLRCDIIGVAPVRNLEVRWYKGNQSLGADAYSADVTRTPVNVSSSISVTPDRTDEGAEFWCSARLDLRPQGALLPEGGALLPALESSRLNVTVHYKPVINTTQLQLKVPVFRGYPQELVCEAEGQPPPWIQWIYDSDKVVRLSGGNLTVYESGFYTCSATNAVASSSRVVQVILTEDYLPLIAGFVAVTVVVISVIFVFIYSIYYKNTKMRRYSLKNPKLSTLSGNVAHNGWDTPLPMTKLS